MGASFTSKERIPRPGGEILKLMSVSTENNLDVAEAYCSVLEPGAVRAWKLHTEMTVRAFVPQGEVKFVVVDDPEGDVGYQEFILGPDYEHGCLTIDPNTWFGFVGGPLGGVVLNMADIVHDPEESKKAEVDFFDYSGW